MKNRTSKVLMAAVCVILGVMISYQLKSSIHPKNTSSSVDLAAQVTDLKTENDDLKKKVAEYEKKIDEYEAGIATESKVVENMKKEMEAAKKLSGLTEVQGKGVVVTLTPVKDVITNATASIRSNHILGVINELNSSGAEAIAINEERFTSRTQIREAGFALKINDTAFSPNEVIVIKAIGKPDVLEGAFRLPLGIKYDLLNDGIEVKVTQSEEIVIPKYTKTLKYEYAK